MKSFKKFVLETTEVNEAKVEDHHYALINTKVNRRVGHGTVFKTEAGAKHYHESQKKFSKDADAYKADHMKVMSVGDAKKSGVPEHNFSNLSVSEEVEQIDEANQVKMSQLKAGDTVKMGKRFGGKQGIVKAVHKDGADVHVHGTESPTFAHHSNFTKISVKEEAEQIDEISKKLAKSYLDKSAAERKANSVYPTREKFRGRMIGGATADAKLKGRVEEPYKFGQAPKRKMRVKVAATNEEVELDENIKGWKNAASDISKMRSAQGKTVKLVSLKKDGNESKMHDATKTFRSEDEAQEHHDRVTKLNPKSKIRHNLYVDGKQVKTLG